LAAILPASIVGPGVARSQPSVTETRSAMEQAAEARVLLWGYFRLVDDGARIAEIRSQMERRLGELGIAARIGHCHWMGVVANGNASGNRAYGGACSVGIGGRPARSFLICSSTFGGITLVAPDGYGFDAEYIELFIRRACL
jgi:hypothetical protein